MLAPFLSDSSCSWLASEDNRISLPLKFDPVYLCR